LKDTGPVESILGAIGHTPLVKLQKVAKDVKPAILAKIEFMNPGGSVKDRIAPFLGLAMLAAVKGYKTIFTMPDKVSEEKRSLLRAFGAEVVVAPTDVAPESPEHYVNVARRLNSETANSFMPNQYANPGNPRAHYITTGPEVWEQTGGKLDAFVACVGTGGTISGAGRFLKEKNKKVRVVGIEPEGSIFYNKKYGTDYPLHTYLVEGIGEDFVPGTYDQTLVDEIIRVSDEESFRTALRLTREEGIFAGGSSGSAVAGALSYAAANPQLKQVVVVIPDSGKSYLSKFYDADWRRSKGLE